jgi:hypothetical protein
VKNVFGLGLGTQLVGQLADPEKLAHEHSHIHSP